MDNSHFYYHFRTLSDKNKSLCGKRVSVGMSEELFSTHPEKLFEEYHFGQKCLCDLFQNSSKKLLVGRSEPLSTCAVEGCEEIFTFSEKKTFVTVFTFSATLFWDFTNKIRKPQRITFFEVE